MHQARPLTHYLSHYLRPWIVAISLVALLAGCETFSDVAQEDVYHPPLAGGANASVQGSGIEEGGLFGSQHRGFVTMVDLKMVPDAAGHWDQPLALTPGKHTIVAEYRYSNFMTRAYVPLEAKAGASYQLMIKNGREATPAGDRAYADFWIVETATGKPVTAVYHRQVSGGKTGTIFYQTK